MSYIGLDVGTSSCKASVVNDNGEIICSSISKYSFESPRPGYVELNPTTVWNSVKKSLGEISSHAQDAKALAVSSIGESMVVLDKNDKPLYNGIVYIDERCNETLPLIKDKISSYDLHKITGVPTNQMFTLCKFLWFNQHIPSVLEKGDKYFLFGDYITYMLSGERAVDPSTASRTMFYDVNKHCWSEEVSKLFNIPINKFSSIASAGTTLNHIRPSLADELNLPKGLNIVVGIHDQCSATLGSGALAPGEIMLGQGSTESINCVIHKNNINESMIEREISFEPYLDNEHFIIITGNLTHGSSINWFMNTVGANLDYDYFNSNCPDTSGNVFFFPYLSKVSLMDSGNSALGGFLGIDVTVQKETMYRAVLEGLCYETRINIDIFKDLGVPIRNICASGGLSKIPIYMQMKADIVKNTIQILSNPQAGIAGLAMICAKSCGEIDNYKEGVELFVDHVKEYRPRRNYNSNYKTYLKASNSIKNLYNNL